MANPKYKLSRKRTRTRRAHDSLKLKSFSLCPNCKSPRLPHRVCPYCGYYKGRQVVNFEEKETA